MGQLLSPELGQLMKVTISRETPSAQMLHEFTRHLVFAPGHEPGTVRRFLSDVIVMLRDEPEKILILVARQGEEMVGFVIANTMPDCVFIAQMWSKPGNAFQVLDEMFLRVMIWAVGLGKISIRAESRRNVEVLHRRVGFIERSVIVEKHISEQVIEQLMLRAREVIHG